MKFTQDIKNILILLDKKHKINLSVVFFFCLLNIFFDLIGIGMIVPIINIVVGNEFGLFENISFIDNFIKNNSQENILFFSMLFFLIFYVFKTFYSTFSIWYQKKFIYETSKDFSEKLLKKYFNLKYLDFIQRNQSELIRNIIFESSIFVTSIIQSLVNLLVEVILVIGISMLLIYYDPISAFILICIIIVLGTIYIFLFKTKLKLLGKERQEVISNILKVLGEGFILQKEIRILQKENYIMDIFSKESKKIVKINILEQIINSFPKIWFEFVAVAGLSGIIFYFIMFDIKIYLLVPLLALYAAAIFRLLPSANRIIGAINNILHNMPAFNVLFEELLNINKSQEKKNLKNQDFDNFNQFIFEKFEPRKLNLKNLSFSYDRDQNEVLENINLSFSRGEITGIIGKSGSGKSTIANIISGLIENYSGTFEINDNTNFNLNILRRSVGYVPQITNLLDDSIKNNICFGLINKNENFEKLNYILKKVDLENFVNTLDDGLNTIVGDQGLTLSGGQRQKIALARTLYLDPKIIIFDESTNSLDKVSEKQFFENITNLKRDKIIVCITHDLSLSKYFDKIYNLSEIKKI